MQQSNKEILNFLDDIKNTKVLEIYGDGLDQIELVYLKNNTTKSLSIQANWAASSMGFPRWFNFSNEPIKENRKKSSLFMDLKDINNIEYYKGYDGGDLLLIKTSKYIYDITHHSDNLLNDGKDGIYVYCYNKDLYQIDKYFKLIK